MLVKFPLFADYFITSQSEYFLLHIHVGCMKCKCLNLLINISKDVPNAGRGLPRLPYRSNEWDPDFTKYLKDLDEKKPVIMCGDLNVAHTEIG